MAVKKKNKKIKNINKIIINKKFKEAYKIRNKKLIRKY